MKKLLVFYLDANIRFARWFDKVWIGILLNVRNRLALEHRHGGGDQHHEGHADKRNGNQS